jgi:hypothetical protein
MVPLLITVTLSGMIALLFDGDFTMRSTVALVLAAG